MRLKYRKFISQGCNVAPVALFLAAHTFLFLPAVLFMESRRFWNYGFNDYLVILFPLFVIVSGVLFLPIVWIKFKWRIHYSAILTGIAFAVWGCNFFVGSKGVEDGASFFIVTSQSQIVMNLLVIMSIGVLFTLVGYFRPKITNTLLILACISSSVNVINLALTEHKKGFLNYQQSQQELTSFSKQKNVLVILLDSFQSDFFQEILARKPLWADELLGFTYYVNAASSAPATILSLPTIHSGNVYRPGDDVDEFYKKNVGKESFLKLLQADGYRAMTLNPYLGYSPSHVARINQNYVSCPSSGVLCEVQQLINYSLFNSVPHLFKKYVYNEGSWLLSQFFPPTEIVSNKVLSVLASNVVTDSRVPTIKFLHLYGAHAPAVLDQSCQLLPAEIWTRKAAIAQAQCAMGHVINVLSALKQHSIYDQTAILIIADHGVGLRSTVDGTVLGAVANPLFLFKSFHQKAPLKHSLDRVGLLDIKEIVCEATNDCSINIKKNSLASVLKTRQSVPFNDYLQDTEQQRVLRVFPYSIKGSPREASSWVKLPPRKKIESNLDFLSESFRDYAGTGWGPVYSNSTYRPIIANQADVFLPLPQNKDVRIKMTASTPNFNKGQVLSVWVNDVFIDKFSIVSEKYNQIEFTIPKEILTKTATHVLFRLSKWNSLLVQDGNEPLIVTLYGKMIITYG